MEAIDSKELWRFIPPEEKIALLSVAQAQGVTAALCGILICGTIAVGIQEEYIFYTSFLFAPLIYQMTAGRAWRGLRPRVMLEYLAARSAARRYAYSANVKDLSVKIMYRGFLKESYYKEELNDVFEKNVFGGNNKAVWIALFLDGIIIMEERMGGAELLFSHLINDKISLKGSSDGYENDLEITINSTDKRYDTRYFVLTSSYPAAQTVFLKKFEEYKELYQVRIDPSAAKSKKTKNLIDDEEDTLFSSMTSFDD